MKHLENAADELGDPVWCSLECSDIYGEEALTCTDDIILTCNSGWMVSADQWTCQPELNNCQGVADNYTPWPSVNLDQDIDNDVAEGIYYWECKQCNEGYYWDMNRCERCIE